MSERMSGGFSVFNGHINDAHKRAMEEMDIAVPAYAEEVREISREGNGIMAIFNQPPTTATAWYVALVTHFVNEGRE